MTRIEQYKINCECIYNWDKVMIEFQALPDTVKPVDLRSCNAEVFETENYYILCSYCTCVAAIDKNTNILYDLLRKVYGYKSTSAQHISKFRHDYTPYPWNYPVLTWRKLK